MQESIPAQFWQCMHDLEQSGIGFIVVGGLALRMHGGNHLTEDLDISPSPERENRDLLAAFLRAKHARPLGFPPATTFTVQPEHGVDSFEGLWNRAVEMDLGGFVVRVASLEDLAAMKRAADRPKDRLHLMEIAALIRLRDEAGEDTTHRNQEP
jgi:hypothetical protein